MNDTTTPATRLQELVDKYSHHPDDARADWLLDPDNAFLLVQESVNSHGLYWLTTFPTQNAASAYIEGEENPEDWTIVGLFNLVTGAQYYAQLRPTWMPMPD